MDIGGKSGNPVDVAIVETGESRRVEISHVTQQQVASLKQFEQVFSELLVLGGGWPEARADRRVADKIKGEVDLAARSVTEMVAMAGELARHGFVKSELAGILNNDAFETAENPLRRCLFSAGDQAGDDSQEKGGGTFAEATSERLFGEGPVKEIADSGSDAAQLGRATRGSFEQS